jgi:hypothetical protein
VSFEVLGSRNVEMAPGCFFAFHVSGFRNAVEERDPVSFEVPVVEIEMAPGRFFAFRVSGFRNAWKRETSCPLKSR